MANLGKYKGWNPDEDNLTWAFVFNSDLKWWHHYMNAENAAIKAGYEYYSWNGVVYKVNEFGRTICYTGDLDEG